MSEDPIQSLTKVIDQVFYLVISCLAIYSAKLALKFYFQVFLAKDTD